MVKMMEEENQKEIVLAKRPKYQIPSVYDR